MKSKVRTIIVFGGILLGLVALIVFARPGGSPGRQETRDARSSAFVVDEPLRDLGTLSMARGTVQTLFSLRNNGNDPVRIDQISTSCMCTDAFLVLTGKKAIGPFGMAGHFSPRVGEIVAPGESFAIKAVFDPAAHGPAGIGPVEREIYVESDAGETTLRFAAIIVP